MKIWQANTRHATAYLTSYSSSTFHRKIKMIQSTNRKNNEAMAKTLFTNFAWFFLHETQWRIFFGFLSPTSLDRGGYRNLLIFRNLSISAAITTHWPFFNLRRTIWQHNWTVFLSLPLAIRKTQFNFKIIFRSRNHVLIGFNIISFNPPSQLSV